MTNHSRVITSLPYYKIHYIKETAYIIHNNIVLQKYLQGNTTGNWRCEHQPQQHVLVSANFTNGPVLVNLDRELYLRIYNK